MGSKCNVIVDEKTVELLVEPDVMARSVTHSSCTSLQLTLREQVQDSPEPNLRRRRQPTPLVSRAQLRVRDPLLRPLPLSRRRHSHRRLRLRQLVLLRMRRSGSSTVLLSYRQAVVEEVCG